MLNQTRRIIHIFRIARQYKLPELLRAARADSSVIASPEGVKQSPEIATSASRSRNDERSRQAARAGHEVDYSQLQQAFEALGPVFIKFGQALSTRPDLIPEPMALALSELQDNVKPFSTDIAKKQIESAFNRPLTDCFATFEDAPLGSASIAQVHGATLHDGTRVVVKVLRPNIHTIIHRDIAVIKSLSKWISRFSKRASRIGLIKVANELEKTLIDELDLVREAANSSVLKRQFGVNTQVHIPRVYWELTTHNVVTFERIHGISIDDKPALLDAGVDLKQLARTGVEVFFKQVFEHGYFHADMHPGNIFVEPMQSAPAKLILVDFGIMGTLSSTDQNYLAQNILAFTNRDYRKVAELHIESGWVPKDTRVDDFESAIRAVCEPMLERPIKDISFGKLLMRLLQTAERFHMTLQPQLILLQKTILSVEGVGRSLDPELNVWQIAAPIIEKWLKDKTSIKAILKKLKRELPTLLARFDHMTQT